MNAPVPVAAAEDDVGSPTDFHAGVSYRNAAFDDALCIGFLGMQVFLDTYAIEGIRPAIAREVQRSLSPAAIERALIEPDVRFVLAEREGHLIAFAQATLHTGHPLVDEPAAAALNRLYVQERFTGRGLGRSLLARMEAAVAEEGDAVLWLTAWIGNARALAFYPRAGYAELGPTVFSFEGEDHENRLFAKRLAGAASGMPAA